MRRQIAQVYYSARYSQSNAFDQRRRWFSGNPYLRLRRFLDRSARVDLEKRQQPQRHQSRAALCGVPSPSTALGLFDARSLPSTVTCGIQAAPPNELSDEGASSAIQAARSTFTPAPAFRAPSLPMQRPPATLPAGFLLPCIGNRDTLVKAATRPFRYREPHSQRRLRLRFLHAKANGPQHTSVKMYGIICTT
jgi:hypothetical protein